MKDLIEFLSLSIELCREAGRAILDIYSKADISTCMKSDNSPLTLADIASNNILYKGLSKTDIPILSEECKEIPYEIRRDWKLFWLIDPLDGTKEFINKNGEFTVNVALIKDNIPVLGIIYAPVKDILYYALKGEGAYKLKNGDKKKLISINREDEVLIVIGSRSHHSNETQNFIERISKFFKDIRFIKAGSSLKFCLLAEGVAHLYPRFGPTMEWDTAAGQIILEETNGAVIDFKTSRTLQYNKVSLINPFFIAMANIDKS